MTNGNPFLERGMIQSEGRFFGRQDELSFCLERLRMMQSVSVVGERRIGKSSLLYRLAQIIPERLEVKSVYYVDLQAIPDADSFWPAVLEQINSKGETRRDFVQALQRQKTILCLDEFDRTAESQRFGADFFNTLRSMANQGHLAMVTATQRPLNALVQPDLTSSFFNLFVRRDLEPFSQEDQAAVRDGVLRISQDSGVALSPDEIERAWARTGGHPWKLAVYLSHLWDAKQAGRPDWSKVEELYLAEIVQGVPARRSKEEGIPRPPAGQREANLITGLAGVAGVLVLYATATRTVAALWIGLLLAVVVGVLIAYALLRAPRSA
jgi:hypothetical protein